MTSSNIQENSMKLTKIPYFLTLDNITNISLSLTAISLKVSDIKSLHNKVPQKSNQSIISLFSLSLSYNNKQNKTKQRLRKRNSIHLPAIEILLCSFPNKIKTEIRKNVFCTIEYNSFFFLRFLVQANNKQQKTK